MTEIEFSLESGDGVKKMVVSQPMGASGVYHVNINCYFEGQLIRCQNGTWTVALSSKTILAGDDICALIETLENGGEK